MQAHTRRKPSTATARARLLEAQQLLLNLARREVSDDEIAAWLTTMTGNVDRWRTGSAVPSPGIVASLRRLERQP